MNKLSTAEWVRVISVRTEGVSVNSPARMTGIAKTTILRLLAKVGSPCLQYYEARVRGLKPANFERDEVWSYYYAKDKNAPDEMKAEFKAGKGLALDRA